MQNNTFSGLIIGQNIINLDRIDSTNDYLKINLSKFTPQDEGTAILAVDQFAGKGQRGNTWISESGKNIITSILLYPQFLKIEEQFALSCAVSLGIFNWLKDRTTKDVTIKWPNDIYVEDKKIAGVLIENGVKGTYLSHSIVGIGINVNQTQFFDPQRTTSLKEISDSSKDYDIPTIVKELYNALNQEYLLLKANKKTEQLKTYNEHLFRRGKLKPFILNHKTIDATIVQVLENGFIQLQSNNETITCNLTELKHII